MEKLTESPAIVIGGGIAGLMAAQTLQHKGRDYILLERCPTLGGLTRTIEVGEFCFDYTGHFLHLCRYASPADIPFANLNNDDWFTVNRKSCCLVGGKLITAPIQYNLRELPQPLLAQCVASYNDRPAASSEFKTSFRDFIVQGFGEHLADLFLIPQNEKTMAVSLDLLSDAAVRRFFPAPNPELIRRGIAEKSPLSSGYNANFWYPRNGGIGSLSACLRQGLKGCIVNRDVVRLDLKERAITTRTGEQYQWSRLFSSMPLKELCAISTDRDLQHAASQMSHSSTISFNIGVRGDLREDLRDVHWIYVPDREIPFYRVGFYSNISRGACAPGHHSLYVEVGVSPEQADREDLVRHLQPTVLSWLEKLGWITASDIVCVATHILRYAYIHHTTMRDPIVSDATRRLNEFGIHLIGRYGLWDYISMEDSIESARNTVMDVA